MDFRNNKNSDIRHSTGSALILAVVLSTLLALVGVLFLMAARVNQMSTSAIYENKTLDFAIDTVTADISQKLLADVPGLTGATVKQEYYDAPDINNLWLANLEPYESGGNYYWRQISDVSGQLVGKNRNISATVVHDYVPITDINNPADADGDGVSDSKWILLSGISTGISKPVYTAVRIIDNSAMLNVNTGYKFDPNVPPQYISDVDGRNQTQIAIISLAGGLPASDEKNLLFTRANNGLGVNPYDLKAYLRNVVWNYGEPNGLYTPFDMSDELELRYRFLLNNTGIDTRIETWSNQFRNNTISTPVASGGAELTAWFQRAFYKDIIDPNYAYRHIATTCNMDRILNPASFTFNGETIFRMVNINTAAPELLYETIKKSLQDREPNTTKLNQLSAQLAVNIVDLRDQNTDVTSLKVGSKTYYGFEAQPFISEIGFKISKIAPDKPENNSFAIELYNPFQVDILLSDFRIELCDANDKVKSTINMTGSFIKAQSRFVISNSNNATTEFNLSSIMSSDAGKQEPNLVLAKYMMVSASPPNFQLIEKYNIRLVRIVTSPKLYLDKQVTQDNWFKWNDANDASSFYSRSDLSWNIIYQEFAKSANTLGKNNGRTASHKNYNLADFKDYFISIGDLARTLTIGPGTDVNDMIGAKLTSEPNEYKIRLDLTNPVFANLFQFLTVIDPTVHGYSLAETRIKGRININTAPWFVMAQLPWMDPAVARDIVSFRNSHGAFDTIGDLMQVPQMSYYAINPAFKDADLDRWPDFTPKDGAIGDFEQRDLLFSRISNLVTVRSDIFTAYILVRIGLDGPQKRVIAILDRSRISSPTDKVRLLALQPVPDPR